VLVAGQAAAFGTLEDIVAGRPELAGRPLEEVFLRLIGRDGASS
jgi:hypothetical protein